MGSLTSRRRFALVAGLVTFAFIITNTGCLPGLAASTTATTTDLLVRTNGFVDVRLTPEVAFKAAVLDGGVVQREVAGTTDATGFARVYLAPEGTRIHNGESVRVTSGATVLEQQVQLSGLLDEDTGVLRGRAVPNAQLSLNIFTSGADLTAETAEPVIVTAASDGFYELDLSQHVTAKATSDRPKWRGYLAKVVSRDKPMQSVYSEVQTPNVTLVSTRNLAGGGHFLPGDTVTFDLIRGGVVVETMNIVANRDGVPEGPFRSSDVGPGDVLRATYRAPGTAGSLTPDTPRSLSLDPWKLTATADTETDTVTGTTAPGAPVVALYHGPSGQVMARGQAAADGTFSLFPTSSTGATIDLVGNQGVIVWRVAEPGFTGVGIQQVELTTAVVRVDDVGHKVSGYNGSNGVEQMRIDVVRSAKTIASVTGVSVKAGKYDLALPHEVLAGDTVVVTAGTRRLPAFEIGSIALTAYRVPSGSSWVWKGTAAPGRSVKVAGQTCEVVAQAASDGSWAAPASACFTAEEVVLVTDTQTSGAATGSLRGRFEFVTAPEAVITSPAAGSKLKGGRLTIKVNAYDHDDAAQASAVDFYLDGKFIGRDTQAPFELTTTVAAGAHRVAARSFDSRGRLIPGTSNPVYADTQWRAVTAR